MTGSARHAWRPSILIAAICAVVPPALEARTAPAQAARSTAAWATVVALPVGQEIIVIADGMPAAKRRFVVADDATLTVLDLTSLGVAEDVKRACLEIARTSPEAIAQASRRRTPEKAGVSLGPDGVFQAGRKVAELAEVAQSMARSRVIEIRHDHVRSRQGIIAGVVIAGAGLAIVQPWDGAPAEAISTRKVTGGMVLIAGTLAAAFSSTMRHDVIYRR